MLNVQVLGSGLIPRGHGIAPRREPFQADKNLIQLMLGVSTLEVYMINPDNNKKILITHANFEKLWATHSGKTTKPKKKPTLNRAIAPKIEDKVTPPSLFDNVKLPEKKANVITPVYSGNHNSPSQDHTKVSNFTPVKNEEKPSTDVQNNKEIITEEAKVETKEETKAEEKNNHYNGNNNKKK